MIWLTGWLYADPLVSAGIGLFILPRTAKLMADAVGVLLEGTPADVTIGELRAAIAAIRGVADVHDLHVWSLTSGVNALSVHVVATDGNGLGDLLSRVGDCASDSFRIEPVTVQVEPPDWKCGGMQVMVEPKRAGGTGFSGSTWSSSSPPSSSCFSGGVVDAHFGAGRTTDDMGFFKSLADASGQRRCGPLKPATTGRGT